MLLLFDPARTSMAVYACAAILPALFLMRYIYRKDTFEKEPASLLWRLILGGLLAAGLSIILERVGLDVVLPTLPIQNETAYYIATALIVGLIEEGTKMLFLRRYTWNNPNFNFRFDGVVYAVFVSLGFAAIENVLYVYQFGLSVAFARAMLAIPAHMGFAVFMGAYYGRAKICEVRGDFSGKVRNMVLSYVVAVALHTFYDAAAMINSETSMMVFMGFVAVMYFIVYNKIHRESVSDREIY